MIDLRETVVRISPPTVPMVVTPPLPPTTVAAVVPVAGPPGPRGLDGQGADPDVPDLVILFENGLI